MSDFGLTAEQRAILKLLHAARGRMEPDNLPAAAFMWDLAERGLVYESPAGSWWLTADGQAVVEAEA